MPRVSMKDIAPQMKSPFFDIDARKTDFVHMVDLKKFGAYLPVANIMVRPVCGLRDNLPLAGWISIQISSYKTMLLPHSGRSIVLANNPYFNKRCTP